MGSLADLALAVLDLAERSGAGDQHDRRHPGHRPFARERARDRRQDRASLWRARRRGARPRASGSGTWHDALHALLDARSTTR